MTPRTVASRRCASVGCTAGRIVLAACAFVAVSGRAAIPAESPSVAVTGATVEPLEIPAARRLAVPLAPFLGEGVAFEDAFAAAVTEAAAQAKVEREGSAGLPVRAVVVLPPGRHRLRRPLVIRDHTGIGVDGEGCTLVQTERRSVFDVERSYDVVVENVVIDYDPLPFTQGTVTAIDAGGTVIDVAVDAGYPADAAFAAALQRGRFDVIDREQEAFVVGGRYALAPASAVALPDRVLRITLASSALDCGPGQRPLPVGDAVVAVAFGPVAVSVRESGGVSFSRCVLHAAPMFGMMFSGGVGGTVLDRVRVVPGPPPPGAARARLCSTNADGTHFNCVEGGPTITGCEYRRTGDDPVNVHGFAWYVVGRLGPRQFALQARGNLGLGVGDTVDVLDAVWAGKGEATIVEKQPCSAEGLAAAIERVWKRKASPADRNAVEAVTIDRDLDLLPGDVVASRTRCGAGTVIRESSFHGGGRVMVKTHDALVEGNTFTRSHAVALHVGADLGFWSETNFARNVTIRGNTFSHCGTSANHLFPDADAFATVFVGGTHPLDATRLFSSRENRDLVIEGNSIEDSYGAALQITNASRVVVRGNTINRTFLRDSACAAGRNVGLVPDAAVIIAEASDVTLTGNMIATGPVATRAVAVDPSCDATVTIEGQAQTADESAETQNSR